LHQRPDRRIAVLSELVVRASANDILGFAAGDHSNALSRSSRELIPTFF